jgi:hypothetical protein
VESVELFACSERCRNAIVPAPASSVMGMLNISIVVGSSKVS